MLNKTVQSSFVLHVSFIPEKLSGNQKFGLICKTDNHKLCVCVCVCFHLHECLAGHLKVMRDTGSFFIEWACVIQ